MKREPIWRRVRSLIVTWLQDSPPCSPTDRRPPRSALPRHPQTTMAESPPLSQLSHLLQGPSWRQQTVPRPHRTRGRLLLRRLPWQGEISPEYRMQLFMTLASVPRPEVVKRVRPDPKAGEERGTASPKPGDRPEAMDVDVPAPRPSGAQAAPAKPTESSQPHPDQHPLPPPAAAANRDIARLAHDSRPSTPNGRANGTPQPPRPPITPEQRRTESGQTMPPPTIPSQTVSAQELRETARTSRGVNERGDERPLPSIEARAIASLPVPPTSGPRRRSPSPPSKPGTRNPSVESRASGGRRSDRDERRPERESRGDGRDYGRREGQSHTRERSSRSARDLERDKDGDRDRERGRDRHGERERVRERDRDRDRERDKEKESRRERERERDRERDRDRDRDRHRDRHRTDEKDRDSRKERDVAREPSTTSGLPPVDERGLPPRPEPSRHRDGDESLGKRRRPTDDEVRHAVYSSTSR